MMQRPSRWIPLFLFLVSLAVRLLAVRLTQFDGLYGQDSFAYFHYAIELRNALAAGQLPPPFFWPLGYPLLIAAIPLANLQPIMGQMISLMAGAAIAPLVYLLVREYRPGADFGGIVAGLLTAVAAQLLLSSLSIMADTTALFWATLSAWLLLRHLQSQQEKWLILAALTLALAVITRWVYALLAIPWGVSALLAYHTAHYSPRQIVKAAALAVIAGGFILGLHFAADIFRTELSYVGDLHVYSWNPANAFRHEQINADGHFIYEYATGYFYARPLFHPAYIFPLFVPFWLIGLWTMRKGPVASTALLIGWLLTIYLFLAGVPWQNWRFPLTFFPPLLVLVGLGLDWLWPRLHLRGRQLLLVYIVLALIGSVSWAWYDVGRFTNWANERRETAVSIAAALPPDAVLVAFDLTATMQHYTAVDTREIFNLTDSDLAEILADETAVYLLINPHNIQSQWAGKSPETNFTWLQTHAELTPINSYGSLVLYQVSP